MRNSIVRAALAAASAAALAAALAPSFAAAQPLGDGYRSGDYASDPCRQEKRDRAVTGAVIGGVLGAVVGSQVSGHGARTEGSVIGGGVGALGGAAVGSSSANCLTDGTSSYYEQDRDLRAGDYGRYDSRDYAGYGGDYDDDADHRAYSVGDGSVRAEDCRLADSVIYMPDGRVEKRFVRVCRDRNGRYQTVE